GGDRALRALVDGQLDAHDLLLVRFTHDAAHPLGRQLAAGGAFRSLGVHLVLVALQGLVAATALFTLGSALLDGHIDFGGVLAWTVLSLSVAPMQYLATRALGRFSLVAGARIKRRLLEGTFRIEDQAIRSQGLGVLLGRANEASLVERVDLVNVFEAMSAL